MPWKEMSTMSLRAEFVGLVNVGETSMTELCRRFGISPKTGYKWLNRYRREGPAGLADRSRRPHRSPAKTAAATEAEVLALRTRHPAWGGRKIAARLQQLGRSGVPSPSTVTAILQRHWAIDPAEAATHVPWQRFEHAAPNQLWQMDFKGHLPMQRGRCHPLTVLDDHSRFALGLEACPNQQGTTVQERLRAIFRRYGLPDRMVMDNGAPWGDHQQPHTWLTVWLLQLGIRVSHGRPYHPQTQGKDERFHRTLKVEVLRGAPYSDLASYQGAFDRWRSIYNLERPHEALGQQPPISRYRVSQRSFPETLPVIEYGPGDQVRRVQSQGEIWFHGQTFVVGKAFRGHPVGLRPTLLDGVWDVFFCHQLIRAIDLRYPDGH